jgi:predicted RNA-binding protein YlqC (UPF0109 family)
MKDLVEYVARALVGAPHAVQVAETERDGKVVLELRVAKSDLGRVIGREGRTARAIRSILAAASAFRNERVILDIIEDKAS